ncbi:MAG: hypothetical protein JRH11_25340, partial [Deltaproteobacteria bacterium]|nr:hypothetical protein [Deltaproteobacteria bacterium]
MAIFYYLVHGTRFTRHDDFSDLPDDSHDISWVHAVAPTPEELDAVLDDMHASVEVREATLDPFPHPEFLMAEGAAWLSFPVQVPGAWTREYLIVIVRGRRMLTITRNPMEYFEVFRRKMETSGAEDADNPMAELFESAARTDRDALEAMRDAVDDLDAQLENNPGSVSIHAIRLLKNAVLRCGNICEDQIFCLAAMATPAAAEVIGDAKTSVRGSMLTLIRHVDRSFDRLDVRARELESQLQMFYQKKTEDRLRVLTVISAVFSPL